MLTPEQIQQIRQSAGVSSQPTEAPQTSLADRIGTSQKESPLMQNLKKGKAFAGGFGEGAGGISLTAIDYLGRKALEQMPEDFSIAGISKKQMLENLSKAPSLHEKWKKEMGAEEHPFTYGVGELGGEVSTLATPAVASGGLVRGAVEGASKGLKLTGKTAKAVDFGRKVAQAGTEGYVFDVGGKLQRGETEGGIKEILSPGMNTAIGAAFPFIRPVAKGIGALTRESLGASTGVGGRVISKAWEAATKGGPQWKAFQEGVQSEAEPIVKEARDALDTIIETRRKAYEAQLEKVKDVKGSYDISSIKKKFTQMLDRYGVIRNKDGSFDFSRAPGLGRYQGDLVALMNTIDNWGSKAGDRTLVGVDKLKQTIDDYRIGSSDSRKFDAFVTTLRNTAKGLGMENKDYRKLLADYDSTSGVIKEVQRSLSLGDKASVDTAFRKLTGALRVNNEFRQALLKELDDASGGFLSSKIAGQQMSEVLPRGIARTVEGVGLGLGAFSGVALVKLIPAAILTSPRAVQGLMRALGIPAGMVGKVFKAIEDAAYGPATKGVSEAVEGSVGAIKENPMGGFVKPDELLPKKKVETKPLTGYHLTREPEDVANIEKYGFDISRYGEGSGAGVSGEPKGIFFFPSKGSFKNLEGWGEIPKEQIIKSDLNLQKPYVVKSGDQYFNEVVKPALDIKQGTFDDYRQVASSDDSDLVTKFLKDKGYDSVIDKKGILSFNEPQIIVFDPKNIKLPQKIKETVQTAIAYKETGNLTTKILKDLEGKTTVSKQYILDATNRGELKQVERDIIRQALETEGDTVNVAEFAEKVKRELLPLKRIDANTDIDEYATNRGEHYGRRYEGITLPDDIRGKVANYSEHIYESPIKTTAGDIHWDTSNSKNYFGHTRIEDIADNQTRRVIEVQSDLYQKGNLEREMQPRGVFESGGKQYYASPKHPSGVFIFEKGSDGKWTKRVENPSDTIVADAMKTTEKTAKLSQYNDPTAHFRMVREEIKKAAEDGKTKLQFPTGETAMKIEGLGDNVQFYDVARMNETRANGMASDLGRQNEALTYATLKPTELKVGQEVSQGAGNQWIITDVLGDGKFKAVQKQHLDDVADNMDITTDEALKDLYDDPELMREVAETFDISGKVDTSNPIYRFYEKDLGRYLTNKYGAKVVTDNKGVTWYEVPVKKEWAKTPVEAFGLLPFSLKGWGTQTYERKDLDNPERKVYYVPGRDASFVENDLKELGAILYGEIGNRPTDKQEFESQVVANILINRMRSEPKKSATQLLREKNQFQAYGQQRYKDYLSGNIPKGEESKVAAINKVLDQIRQGKLKNNIKNASFYGHAKDGTIRVFDTWKEYETFIRQGKLK